jgi:hypothetical protein
MKSILCLLSILLFVSNTFAAEERCDFYSGSPRSRPIPPVGIHKSSQCFDLNGSFWATVSGQYDDGFPGDENALTRNYYFQTERKNDVAGYKARFGESQHSFQQTQREALSNAVPATGELVPIDLDINYYHQYVQVVCDAESMNFLIWNKLENGDLLNTYRMRIVKLSADSFGFTSCNKVDPGGMDTGRIDHVVYPGEIAPVENGSQVHKTILGIKYVRDNSNRALGEAYRDPRGLIWGDMVMNWGTHLNQYQAANYCASISARLPTLEEFILVAKDMGFGSKKGYETHTSDGKFEVLPHFILKYAYGFTKYQTSTPSAGAPGAISLFRTEDPGPYERTDYLDNWNTYARCVVDSKTN